MDSLGTWEEVKGERETERERESMRDRLEKMPLTCAESKREKRREGEKTWFVSCHWAFQQLFSKSKNSQ